MKRLACILFFLQFCCHMYAEEPVISNHNNRGVKFKYGLEWGMSGNILNYNISTFITDVQSLVQLYGRGGYGYRIDIGNGLAMDIKSCLQVSFSHPDVNDKYTGKTVPIANLRQSNSISLNTIISVALIF